MTEQKRVRLIAIAGSTRKDSFNKKLVRFAAGKARAAGADVTEIDLAEYPLPLYDGDLEAADGIPPQALELKGIFKSHDGLLISAAEYNSSITAVLKNAIDWLSRPADGEPTLAAFKGKVAALLSASPGALGGLRGLVHVRAILGNIGVVVLPDQVAVPKAHEVFDADGALKDERTADKVTRLAAELVSTVAKLKA